jgi:hypothetical protein
MSLARVGDYQGVHFLIRWSKHKEACDGGSDWGSLGLRIDRFAAFCVTTVMLAAVRIVSRDHFLDPLRQHFR